MRFWDEIRKYPVRFLKTTELWACYLSLGMSLAIVGPTLLDLRHQVRVEIKEISFLLPARAGGQAAGSLIMGFLYPHINFQVAAACCMIASSLLTFAMPYLNELWLMILIFVLNGIAMGAFESGSNIYVLKLWGKETQPFMQSLHFMFGMGSILAPLIALPFLIDSDGDVHAVDHSNSTQTTYQTDELQLVYPYTMLAIFTVFTAIYVMVIWYYEPETTPHPSRDENKNQENDLQISDLNEDNDKQTNRVNEENGRWLWFRFQKTQVYKCIVVILVLFFMHIYLGLEISFGSYLTAFVVKSGLPLTKSDGAAMTTVFWSSFTLFRVLTICYIEYVGTEMNILGSLMICLLANCFLVPFGTKSVPLLWTGVVLIGIGTSSIWACIFGYLELFFPVTSFIGSLMLGSAVLGEFVFPFIISSFIDTEPRILLWVTLFSSLSTTVLFLLILFLCRTKLRRE